MTSLWPDLRLAVRGLRRSPLFAAVAILSLALGIGANTAIFTLIDQILLRKLPVKDPEELVMLFQRGNHNGSNMGGRMHSYPIYQDYQQKAQPLSQVICRRLVAASVAIDNQTERVSAEMVSGNYFDMLGVAARRGPGAAFRRRRPGLQRPSRRRPEPRLLGVAVRQESWRHRQEDPDQQLPDDDRRRVGGRLCRHRPGAVAPDPRADPDEAGDAAGMGLDARRRPARPVGAGVCPPQARADGRKRRRADAGPVHADPSVRGHAARRQGLVGL